MTRAALRRKASLCRNVEKRILDLYIALGRGHERHTDTVRLAAEGDALARCYLAVKRASRGLRLTEDHREHKVRVDEGLVLSLGACACWYHHRYGVC